MSDVVLATFNARWAHAALGLRCLRANLGPLRDRTALVEATLEDRPVDVAERVLALDPRVVGLGVYVWNARASLELAGILKQLRPDLCVVAGGPEVSYESASLPITALVDHVITGEGEVTFARLAADIVAGRRPTARVLEGERLDLAAAPLPFDEYGDDDLRARNVYLEGSRGCPFGCEFCLSSIDRHVRRVPLDRLLPALDRLWSRGLRRFRFVDRTFNLNLEPCRAMLELLLARATPDLFVHLEVVPDRVPDELLELLARFPAGAVQLEVGIQTLDDHVAARIGRPQQGGEALAIVTRLRHATGAHIHADLIAGLPGEDLASFGAGFDRLLACEPQEIQVGILKRLRGTTLSRHDHDFGMVWATEPPYELLANRHLDFATLQRLKRFAGYWDRLVNSGQLRATAPLLWHGGSPFAGFLAFSDWLHDHGARPHGIALDRLFGLVSVYLTTRGLDPARARELLAQDWQRHGRRPLPAAVLTPGQQPAPAAPRAPGRPPRQARHQR